MSSATPARGMPIPKPTANVTAEIERMKILFWELFLDWIPQGHLLNRKLPGDASPQDRRGAPKTALGRS
jgi:hypothetical protein